MHVPVGGSSSNKKVQDREEFYKRGKVFYSGVYYKGIPILIQTIIWFC